MVYTLQNSIEYILLTLWLRLCGVVFYGICMKNGAFHSIKFQWRVILEIWFIETDKFDTCHYRIECKISIKIFGSKNVVRKLYWSHWVTESDLNDTIDCTWNACLTFRIFAYHELKNEYLLYLDGKVFSDYVMKLGRFSLKFKFGGWKISQS